MIPVNDHIRAKVEALPSSPGVYQWKDKNGKVIYVGKAVNLKNRVRSYVREDKNRSPKVAAMMNHAEDLDITMTHTEMEALILECNLIKELHPRYNISLRDDKTYPYVKITMADEWPRILITRYMKYNDGARYFGPFTDVGSLRETLRLLRRYYPIRTCRNMNVPRPCLQYHLHLCCAPCAGFCEKEKYLAMVEDICHIFEGKNHEIIQDLTQRMEESAEKMDYETAARFRNQIQAVKSVQQRQNIISGEGDYDVIGLARSEEQAGIEIFYIRYGRMVGKENFYVPDSRGDSSSELLEAFVKDFYGTGTVPVPREIIIPYPLSEEVLLSRWLSGLRRSEVRLYVPERGVKKNLKDMAQANAEKYLSDRRLQWEYTRAREEGAVDTLYKLLGLPQRPERIECFDISHIQGAETTGSMVVFENGRPARGEYRKFKLITTQGKADDFRSMAEVMQRRYGKEKDWPVPDLIVVDGGRGQLNAVLPVIRNCGVEAPVIGLAKRMEEIFVEDRREPVVLDRHEPALQLLQYIRDEAHRFVITYHRQWTVKRNAESILDHIPGIGPKRRGALWKAFRSLDDIKKATPEELQMVPGLNKAALKNIYQFFHLDKEGKRTVIMGQDSQNAEDRKKEHRNYK